MSAEKFTKQHPLAKKAFTDEFYQEEWYVIMEDYAQSLLKEKDKEIKKAYIDGTDSCHKAFQPLLKSALKHQRYLCADEIKYDPEVESTIIDDFKDSVLNAQEPKI